MKKTVFIGGGNMAEALLKGMLAGGELSAESVTVTDVREDRLAELAGSYGVGTTTDNVAALADAQVVWLCVKPQQMDAVLAPLAGVAPEARYVSIAAGVSCARIESLLGGSVRVVRVMPNTPALVLEGMAGVAKGTRATEADLNAVVRALNCVGNAVVVEEADLHAVTAVSGSGPAYVFYLMEHLQRAATELGLEPDAARELVVQTVLGAARLMRESGESAAALRERVTSKGGTTAAALETFGAARVGEGIVKGLHAAAVRSRELAGE